ncbi:MAG: LPS-assembly protein LptD [Alphaproteobacteria bacterium]
MGLRAITHFLFFLTALTGLCANAYAQMLTGFPDKQPEKENPAEAYDNNLYFQDDLQGRDITPQPLRADETHIMQPQNRGGGLLTGFAGAGNTKAPRTSPQNNADSAPVDLQADELINDEDSQIVTARGNVMLVQAGRILRADEIRYDVANDRVIAEGYVVLNEPSGDIHTASRVELFDEMKSGFVDELKTYLSDGSRFTAQEGERKNATKTIMRSASYTPCEPCKENPDKPLVWQIKASELTHHEDEHRISYNNARFELLGVPVAYTPYFSHPDGTVERKSGFLTPVFGLDSELGFSAGTSYYWDIAPEKDATFGLRAFTEQLPLATAQWRQRWDKASLKMEGGITYSQRDDRIGGQTVTTDEELRGHIFGEGLWDLNEKWRTGFDIEYASDDQYLRQYDFSSKDVLENELYAERFSGRNYTALRALAFQDVRVGDLQNEDQPQVLPEIISNWVGEPGSMPLIGGRWDLEGSLLGLHREGEKQDMMRVSLEAGWYRRLISDYGLVTMVDADVRGDFYHVREIDFATPTADPNDDITDKRIFPQMHIESSYPLARGFETSQLVIEPIAALTLAPNVDTDDNIPNEDSQDIQLDASNLFEPNRFPGLDRVEDQSRVTYGLKTGLYSDSGSYGSFFFGQSRRFDDDDNPFPRGSGLDEQASDFVGEFNMDYQNKYRVNYRFQLASDNLASERHEFDSYTTLGGFDLNMRYLYANALEGTELDASREQIAGDLGYFWNDRWRSVAGAVQDLGQSSGLRQGYIGLEYFGQCLSWSARAVRNLTDDASGDSSTELVLRIGLKNLGEFQASGIELARTESDTPDAPVPNQQTRAP